MQYVKLNNGIEMPILGFGVFQIPDHDECERAVSDAIKIGYRLIDTAQIYLNEEAVGNAIVKSGIDRKDFFLVTKIWVSNAGYEKAKASLAESLKKLKTDYIDLLLVHQPFNDYYGTYRALEEAYRTGQVKAIGISNFYPARFVDLSYFCEIQPAVNQIETHVFQQQQVAREIMKKYNTQIMSWAPFAEGKNNFFQNEILKEIGEKYNKSVAQVALRFLTQEGIVVIPKSVHKERMEENFNIFDFELSTEDKQTIKALDTATSLFFSHQDPATVDLIVNYGKKL